ncbi:hypothetical protein RHSIM_RhsimUnG0005900 [Rhododendron simsii]|uniref:RRM domain-containing protein n=1 Tax=Rhododendron simsii TaxID=118357 RepID=A0A834L5A1_RHOSS|nr:hypothetical protein RHSIM_RhsimUnG0087700 [Rhododendron simsii]KAF7117051.1 hypothetical protein RHSIM_RhsimUnG0005900 [Rhododendron simsii]
MTSATGPLIKSLFIPKCSITAVPTLFATKPSHPFHSKPTKFPSFSGPFPSWVSLKNKISPSSSGVSLVAQTSDWAQEEEKEEKEENPVEGFKWGGEEESGEGSGGVEESEESYSEPPEEAKVFVGGLPFELDSEKLAQLFEQAGVVEIAEVIYNRETDMSRGFGFVTMSTVEEAEKAVEMFNRYELNGRTLTVNKAAPRGSRPERLPRSSEPVFRIYVGNLPWEVDGSRLEQVFSEHGKVVDAKVVSDRETGRSRGFGFVTMSSEIEVNDAIAALDGQV